MRNLTGWPTNTDALEPIYRVVHGGKDREANSLSIKRTLPSSQHAQVVGVGGITQATGQVTWASRSDVTTSHATAFNRSDNWPPRTRDRVDVYTGYRTTTGDVLARQLYGTISGSSGDPMADTQSGMVDVIARLSRKVTLPPLLAKMPPASEGGAFRCISLYPTFFTDVAARAGGFYSTPPMSSGCVLSAPLMGSAWPERGTVTASRRASQTLIDVAPAWLSSSWGMSVRDADLRYTVSGTSTLNRAMEITAMFAVFGGTARVQVSWSNLILTLSRTAGSFIAGMGGYGNICTLPASGSEGATMRVVPSGGNLIVTLRDQAGNESTATVAGSGSGSITSVQVTSDDISAGVCGVQVAFPTTAWTAVNYTRNAYLSLAAHNVSLTAAPPIIKTPARDLLEDQSNAELAALWIDGDGALHWVNRNELVAGNPVATLTSRDNLKSLAWEEDFTAVSYNVEVEGRRPEAILLSKYPDHEVWSSNYAGVDADGSEVFEELLHPDTDEDWIMVDTGFNSGNFDSERNRGRGSQVGLYYEFFNEGTGNGSAGISSNWASASATRIDHRTYKVVTTVASVDASSWPEREFSLKVPDKIAFTERVWTGALGGANLPVVRAHAKTMWVDSLATALTGATSDAPTLTHDVGWWVQDAGACQTIADLLAAQTGTPRPFLRGVSIVPDARLERGDIVTLSDPDITGVEFRCLVVGIEDDFSSSPIRWSQSCDFRVLDYFTTTATLSELDAAWAGELLAALDAARANDTLAQFDTDPLKGAPQ